jgi:hypothetical protein
MPKSRRSKNRPALKYALAIILIGAAVVVALFATGMLATVTTGPHMSYWSPADGSTFQVTTYGGNVLGVTMPLTVQVNIPTGSYVDSLKYTVYADGVAFVTDKVMNAGTPSASAQSFTDSLVLGSHSSASQIKIVYTLLAENANEVIERTTHTITLTSSINSNPTPTTGEVKASATFQGSAVTASIISTSTTFNRATTPFDISNVQPGSYVLNASYQKLITDSSGSINHIFSSQKTVTITANQITTVVFDTWIDMTPTQPTYYGVLTVIAKVDGTATSGVAITINGISDTTPYSKQLPVGSYIITATYGSDTETATANVLTGQTVTSTISLTSGTPSGGSAQITFNAIQSGSNVAATLSGDSQVVGRTTPVTVTMTAGSYSITATFNSLSQTIPVTVVSGQAQTVTFNDLTSGPGGGSGNQTDTHVTVIAQGNAIFQLVDDKSFSGSITLPNGTSYAVAGAAPTVDIGPFAGNVTISIGSLLFSGSAQVAIVNGNNTITLIEGFSLLVWILLVAVILVILVIVVAIALMARGKSRRRG